jgi:hypothetical protein
LIGFIVGTFKNLVKAAHSNDGADDDGDEESDKTADD